MRIIYKFINRINGKQYIGKTIGSVEKRKQRHMEDVNNGSDCIFHRAIRKYGIDNFDFKIYDYTGLVTEKELLEIEQDEILRFRTYVNFEDSNGYNMTLGGEGSSGANTKQVKQYDLKTGKIIKIFKSITEASIETNNNRVNISACCRNPEDFKSCGGYGWCFIDDAPPIYTNLCLTKVKQYDLKTLEVIKVWDSIIEARDLLKITNISSCVNGQIKSAGGFGWCHINDSPIIYSNNKIRKIKQYNLKTLEVIKVWDSMTQIEDILKIPVSNISNICNNKRKSSRGFGFCFDTETPVKLSRRTTNKPINQIDLKTGKIIKTWCSQTKAKKELNISTITNCLTKKIKTAGGFKWEYLNKEE
jgi:hypothetical protein